MGEFIYLVKKIDFKKIKIKILFFNQNKLALMNVPNFSDEM